MPGSHPVTVHSVLVVTYFTHPHAVLEEAGSFCDLGASNGVFLFFVTLISHLPGFFWEEVPKLSEVESKQAGKILNS